MRLLKCNPQRDPQINYLPEVPAGIASLPQLHPEGGAPPAQARPWPGFLSVSGSAFHQLLGINPTTVGISYGTSAVRSQCGWEAPVLQMAWALSPPPARERWSCCNQLIYLLASVPARSLPPSQSHDKKKHLKHP